MRGCGLTNYLRPAIIALLALAALAAPTVFRAEALPPIIDLSTTNADLTVYGEDPEDRFGVRVAAGDINGDTIQDLIVGAYWADSAVVADAGKAYVIYGGPTLSTSIDLNSTSADITVSGRDVYGRLGTSLAVGDINGDTIDDLIVGADAANPPGRPWAGEVYVIYGGPSLPAAIDLNTTSADVTVLGDDSRDHAGSTVAAGDINGDGVDDLIVSAWFADGPGTGPIGPCDLSPGDRCLAGEAYVIYGDPSLPATIDLDSVSADLTIYGRDIGDELAYSAHVGDINGDGTDDLIVSARRASPAGGGQAGETYVIYGGPALPAAIDLNTTTADLAVLGDDPDDRSGSFVAAGDVNGDGTDDLLIGAWPADPGARTEAGETYAVYGGPSLPATIDLNSTAADLTVLGDDVRGRAGWIIAAGDISGDTTDDLIIGAHRASPGGRQEAGETYAIYGGPSLPATIDLSNTAADLAVLGDDKGDFSGYAVATGDINGDSTDDLIVGALIADPLGRYDAGEVYVIYGDVVDSDGDGVPDPRDSCPAEAGSPTNSGCPFPPSVGGIVDLTSASSDPLADGAGSSPREYTAPLAVGVAAGVIALAAGAWYLRRRRLR